MLQENEENGIVVNVMRVCKFIKFKNLVNKYGIFERCCYKIKKFYKFYGLVVIWSLIGRTFDTLYEYYAVQFQTVVSINFISNIDFTVSVISFYYYQ